jgi:hypothetical protein
MRSHPFFVAKALLLALCFVVVPISQATPIEIQAGDSFRFDIDFTGATPAGPYSYIDWHVNTAYTDGFNLGDSLTVALFDDADPNTALGSDIFNWNTAGRDFSFGSMIDANPAFDGTGFLQFTLLSGSIDLSGGYVLIYDGNTPTNGLAGITVLPAASVSVPEPNTLSLLGLALLLIVFFAKVKRSQIMLLRPTLRQPVAA